MWFKPIERLWCFQLENFVKWFGYIQAAACAVGVVVCIAGVMSYDEETVVVENLDGTKTTSTSVLVGERTMYLVLLVYFALGVGFSYLLVLAVNRVSCVA